MKPGALTRRAGLASSKGLTRSAGLDRQTPLAPVSKRRLRLNAERRAVLEAAWGPRPWRCHMKPTRGSHHVLFTVGAELVSVSVDTLGRCHGPVNAHEILSRERAGRTDANLLDVANMVPLCNFHNDAVSNLYPELAHRLGLLRHSWDER